MYYLIYKITNNLNGKVYIGSHKTSDMNDSYMGSGTYLKRAQEKYGLENFEKEILFVFDNPIDMYNKETELVNESFLSSGNTYNIKIGGMGGFDYINKNPDKFLTEKRLAALMPWSEVQRRWREKYDTDEDFRQQIKDKLARANSIAKEMYPNGTFYGKTHTNETKQKISKVTSIAQAGTGNSQYGTIWITNGVDSKKIKNNDVIPSGWLKGRVIKKK